MPVLKKYDINDKKTMILWSKLSKVFEKIIYS